MADSNPVLQHAIPLGRGRGAGEVYHFGNFLKFITKDGNIINPWATGQWVDPKLDPNYDHTTALEFQAGQLTDMPYWDKDFIREMLAVEDFARPGTAEKIAKWIKDGNESFDLIAKVKEDGGLVTLKDFGLEITNTETEEVQGG